MLCVRTHNCDFLRAKSITSKQTRNTVKQVERDAEEMRGERGEENRRVGSGVSMTILTSLMEPFGSLRKTLKE